MTKDPACCTPDMSLEAVSRLMLERDCGAIPVVRDRLTREPIGIITDRDIVTRTIAHGHDPMTMVAGECMTIPVVTISAGARLHDCVELLEVAQIRRAIVVDDSGGCVGMIAQADIARHASKRETGDLVREVSQPTKPAFAG